MNINERGTTLLEYITSTQMDVLNQGNEPTFVTANRREVIDLTLATMNIKDKIHGWRVEDEPSMSDHRIPSFGIKIVKPKPEFRRKLKDTSMSFKIDWPILRENMAAKWTWNGHSNRFSMPLSSHMRIIAR